MSPPLPLVGSGEPVAAATALAARTRPSCSSRASPTGIVTRQDLLAFLAARG